MAWIQVEDSIREHDKIYNLADTLNIPDSHAVGLMVCLWCWAATAANDGDVTNFPPRAIAKAAGWTKKTDIFYEALKDKKSLFIEEVGGRRLVLRNWEQRAEMLIEVLERKREQTKQRVQRYRSRKANKQIATRSANVTQGNAVQTVTSNAGNADVTPLPNLTGPNLTGPKDNESKDSQSDTEQEEPQPGESLTVKMARGAGSGKPVHHSTTPDGTGDEQSTIQAPCLHHANTEQAAPITVNLLPSTGTLSPTTGNPQGGEPGGVGVKPPESKKPIMERRFEEFWKAYPKKVGKKAAESSWKKIKPGAELHDRIITAIGRARVTEQWQREGGRYIPNPATWLNQGRWDDEYEEVTQPYGGNGQHFIGNGGQQPQAQGAGHKPDALAGFKQEDE